MCKKPYVPLFLAILAAGCVAPEDHVELQHAPILGGTAASVGQYPTVVAVYNTKGYICTGTLIAPDLVATAAHCVEPSEMDYSSQSQVTNSTIVLVDTMDLNSSSGTQIAAADTLPNPGFDGNNLGRHDIGLVWLSQSVNDRTPTPLNRVHNDALAGITTTLAGYGLTNPSNQNSAGQLYVLPSKTSVGCSQFGYSDSYLLCYNQSDGTGSCNGDSGGPSFATIDGTQKLVGVTSFGDYYCSSEGEYTRIDAELDFIDANAPELACLEDGDCNADCGSGGLPDDPDCGVVDPCAADSSCNTDCYSGTTSSDPDCPDCSSNGSCNSACGTGGIPADPDCSVADPCAADGNCNTDCYSGTTSSDPDCPDCSSNGTCNPSCGTGSIPSDPDCPECVYNTDCNDSTMECVNGSCVPIGSNPSGSLGDTCNSNQDCLSGICGAGPDGSDRCVQLCDPSASTCPDGFDCLPAGSSGACWPTSGTDDTGDDTGDGTTSGGCAVGGSGSSGASALGMLLLTLVVFRRRRRHVC